MNSKVTTIGITGGQGLIGKALRRHLTCPVVFVSRQQVNDDSRPNETFIQGSFTDEEVQQKFTRSIDVLVHAASMIGPRSEYDKIFLENDLVGTIELAKKFFKNNPDGHFVFLSTAGGLYDLSDPTEKTEESSTDPKSLYGAINLIIEDYLEQTYGESHKITVLRPAPIYGDSTKKNRTVGLIDLLLDSTLRNPKDALVNIFDRLESARDYLHVSDLVRAIEIVINNKKENGFQVYNIGTGVETSIADVISIINDLSGGRANVKILPVETGPTSLIVNATKISKHTGWLPQISLREGICQMYYDLQER